MKVAKVSKGGRDTLSPNQGAFVIKFRSRADVEEGQFTGRAEHVASGETGHFQTPEDLMAFMRRVLTGQRGGQPESWTQERGTG